MDENICGVTGTDEHSKDCRYLGNDAWDCGKLDNQPAFAHYSQDSWENSDSHLNPLNHSQE